MLTVRERQADTRTHELMARLQVLTTRQLSAKWPSVPADDAFDDWSTTLGILDDVR